MLMPGYLPKKIVITKQKNKLIQLGYFDSDENFHGEGIPSQELVFSNEPEHGFKIVTKTKTLDKLGDLGGRIALVTPGKKFFTLSARALAALLAYGTVKYGEIKEPCAFGWMDGELYLLPWRNWDSENKGDGIYAQFYRSTQLGSGAVDLSCLDVGATYKIEGFKEEGIYLGVHKFVKLEKTHPGELRSKVFDNGPIFKVGDYYHMVSPDLSFRKTSTDLQDVNQYISRYKLMTEDRDIVSYELLDIEEVSSTELEKYEQVRKEIYPGYFTTGWVAEDYQGGFRIFSNFVDAKGEGLHDATDLTTEMAKKMHDCATHDLYQEHFSREDLYSYFSDNGYKFLIYRMKSGKTLRRLYHNGIDRVEERYVNEGLDYAENIMSCTHPAFGPF